MKVAIAAKTNSLDGIISGRFERSKWLIIINTENNAFNFYKAPQESIDKNEIVNKMAQELSKQEVSAVLTESCGPKALQILTKEKIKAFNASDMTIAHAIERFKNNKLREFQAISTI